MIFLKLVVDICCGALNALGGYHWLFCRRYIMPVLLAVSSYLITHSWFALTILLCIAILVLGYKNFGKGNFSRGCWSFVVASTAGIGCVLSGHFPWYFYLPWIVGAGVLGGLLVNAQQIVGDTIEGCWLGLIIFLVR